MSGLVMQANDFFEAVNERQQRELSPFPGAGTGLCGSCGKYPRVTGFNMCAGCRVNAGLPVDKASAIAFKKILIAERQSRSAGETPRKETPMGEKGKPSKMPRTWRYCSCGFKTDWAPAWARHMRRIESCGGHKVDIECDATVDVPIEPLSHDSEAAGLTEVEAKRIHEENRALDEADHCPHVDDCNADPAFTYCGADPCHLVDKPARSATMNLKVDVTCTTSMRDELVDTKLRLVAAMASTSEIPLTTRAAITGEVDRIRSLLSLRTLGEE